MIFLSFVLEARTFFGSFDTYDTNEFSCPSKRGRPLGGPKTHERREQENKKVNWSPSFPITLVTKAIYVSYIDLAVRNPT